MPSIKKIYLLVLVIGLSFHYSKGQLITNNNQYYLSPYLVNPGALASNNVIELDLNYRKQFLSIKGAPETFRFQAQMPFLNNFAAGLTALGGRLDIYESYGAMLSLSYKQHFSKERNSVHYLSLGLSGGYGMSNLNYGQIDNPLDPAIANLANQIEHPLGQIGLHYQWNNLMFGTSLRDVFGAASTIRVSQQEEIEFVPTYNTFSYLKYDFLVGDDFAITPWVAYSSFEDKIEDGIVEGMLLVNYRNLAWIGASYQHEIGNVYKIGFNLLRLIKIGYGYENLRPSSEQNSSALTTHELHLNYQFIKRAVQEVPDELEKPESTENTVETTDSKRDDKETKDTTIEPAKTDSSTAIKTEPVIEEEISDKVEEPTIEENIEAAPTESLVEQPEEKKQEVEVEPTENKNKDGFKSEVTSILDGEQGFYIIAGAFSSTDNAQVYANAIKREGYKADIGFYGNSGYFYVILAKEEKIESAKQILSQIRTAGLLDFDKAWILNID